MLEKPTITERGVLVAVKCGFRIFPGPAYGDKLEELIERGWVERLGDKLTLTEAGMLAWDRR